MLDNFISKPPEIDMNNLTSQTLSPCYVKNVLKTSILNIKIKDMGGIVQVFNVKPKDEKTKEQTFQADDQVNNFYYKYKGNSTESFRENDIIFIYDGRLGLDKITHDPQPIIVFYSFHKYKNPGYRIKMDTIDASTLYDEYMSEAQDSHDTVNVTDLSLGNNHGVIANIAPFPNKANSGNITFATAKFESEHITPFKDIKEKGKLFNSIVTLYAREGPFYIITQKGKTDTKMLKLFFDDFKGTRAILTLFKQQADRFSDTFIPRKNYLIKNIKTKDIHQYNKKLSDINFDLELASNTSFTKIDDDDLKNEITPTISELKLEKISKIFEMNKDDKVSFLGVLISCEPWADINREPLSSNPLQRRRLVFADETNNIINVFIFRLKMSEQYDHLFLITGEEYLIINASVVYKYGISVCNDKHRELQIVQDPGNYLNEEKMNLINRFKEEYANNPEMALSNTGYIGHINEEDYAGQLDKINDIKAELNIQTRSRYLGVKVIKGTLIADFNTFHKVTQPFYISSSHIACNRTKLNLMADGTYKCPRCNGTDDHPSISLLIKLRVIDTQGGDMEIDLFHELAKSIFEVDAEEVAANWNENLTANPNYFNQLGQKLVNKSYILLAYPRIDLDGNNTYTKLVLYNYKEI